MDHRSLVFRNVRLPGTNDESGRDVLVEEGRFRRIDRSVHSRKPVPEVDARGAWLLPGAVDMHVHLRDPGLTHKEDLESGTRAAVTGGVTTVCDMPNTVPPTLGAEDLRAKHARAREVARCEVLFYLGLGQDNQDQIARCLDEPSFAGVKVFLGATTGDLLSGDRALDRAVDRFPCLFVFHAEDEAVLREARRGLRPDSTAADHHLLRPPEAVVQGALRVAALWRPGRRLHLCHLSSERELEVLRDHPGLTGEVTPHHLWFTAEDTAAQGNWLKVNPPVRLAGDREALRRALADGTIAAVATDHAPHTPEEKALPYDQAPSGIPGLETSVPAILRLVQRGLLSLDRAVEVLSTAPARLLGLGDRGAVAEGLRADCFLWDPEGIWVPAAGDLVGRCPCSPFLGSTLASRPLATWVAGSLVHASRTFSERTGITAPAD